MFINSVKAVCCYNEGEAFENITEDVKVMLNNLSSIMNQCVPICTGEQAVNLQTIFLTTGQFANSSTIISQKINNPDYWANHQVK